MAVLLTEREANLVRLSDLELVRRTYEHMRTIDGDDADGLYFFLQEAFERWAPHAEWAEHERYAYLSGEDRIELEAARDAILSRAEARCRARLGLGGD